MVFWKYKEVKLLTSLFIKKLFLILVLNCFLKSANAQSVELQGKVVDESSKAPLAGVTVAIKGEARLAMTNKEGAYFFQKLAAEQIVLVISHVGYETKEVEVTASEGMNTIAEIGLSLGVKSNDVIVVSASRRSEKITDAPASIQVIGKKELEQFTGSNVGELAAYVQGVEFVRMGVDNVSFNARGLNNSFNNKVFQMVDGRNSMSPLSGSLLMGNNVSVVKDDIDRIEILLGPQTALYGPNVHNALFYFITKDPRKHPGTTLAVTVGNQSQFSARLRHAGKIGDKWAYKITAEQVVGKEFEFRDSIRGVGGGVYGPLDTVGERINFDFRRIRGEAHVYYYLTPKATIIASAGGSKNTTINTQSAGHNQFVDMSNHFMQVRFTSPRFYATAYNAGADFGNSYNVTNYTRDFWNRTHSRITDPGDARFTSQGLLSAEEADAFAKQRARLKETPKRFNAEAQYNYSFVKQKLVVVAGLSYQNERPRGYGVNLVDSFQRIYITQYGAVMQVDKSLPWNVRFIGAARLDNHSNFGTYVSPKLGLMKAVGKGNLRLTWGRAVSMPSILYQYATTANFFFGNGEGITYIPNDLKVTDTASFKTTRRLQPEEVKTWEIGYKGNLLKKLLVDVTLFNGVSRNFLHRQFRLMGGHCLWATKG